MARVNTGDNSGDEDKTNKSDESAKRQKVQ